MSDIIPFDFESHAVRSVLIDGTPWFVAADVCRVLEIVNVSQAVRRLDDDEKGVCKVYTLGGEQDLKVVAESGLYGLIGTSNKPSAKRFWKWVRAVVLPALIRDGYYAMPGAAAVSAIVPSPVPHCGAPCRKGPRDARRRAVGRSVRLGLDEADLARTLEFADREDHGVLRLLGLLHELGIRLDEGDEVAGIVGEGGIRPTQNEHART